MLTQRTLSNQKALAITDDLIPHIKLVLAVLFPNTKSTTRLEIFARVSGYKTWASLKEHLKSSPEPVLLFETYTLSPDSFWEKMDLETKQNLNTYEEIGVLELIFAGLNKSFSRQFGWIGLPKSTQCSDLIFYTRGIPRFSPFSKEPQGPTLILLSPQNLKDAEKGGLIKKTGPDMNLWTCIFVSKTSADRFFDMENIEEPITRTAQSLEKILLQTLAQKTFFYSKEDEQSWSRQTSSRHLLQATHVRHAFNILDNNARYGVTPFDVMLKSHYSSDRPQGTPFNEIVVDFFGAANATNSYTPNLLTTEESKKSWREYRKSN